MHFIKFEPSGHAIAPAAIDAVVGIAGKLVVHLFDGTEITANRTDPAELLGLWTKNVTSPVVSLRVRSASAEAVYLQSSSINGFSYVNATSVGQPGVLVVYLRAGKPLRLTGFFLADFLAATEAACGPTTILQTRRV